MDLFSLRMIHLPKLICRPTECLIHYHGEPHSIASDQKTYFTAKALMVLLFVPCSSLSTSSSINRFYKDAITVLARWKYIAMLGQCSIEGCICFGLMPKHQSYHIWIIWYYLFHSQNAQLQKSRGGHEDADTHHYP